MPEALPFALQALPAVVGGIGAIGSMQHGAPASNVQLPNSFQMPGMGDAASGALSGIGGLQNMNTPGNLMSSYGGAVNNLMNNPYGVPGIQNMADTSAAGMGVGRGNIAAGQGMQGMGQFLQGQGAGFMPWMQPLLQAGFDPQQALYARTAQQTQDQTRAGLEARGLDSSPYGAGIEGQTMSNFNIDWQNNQLQRMLAGASGAGGVLGAGAGAIGQGGNQITAGGGLAGQGVGQMASSAMLPYTAFNDVYGGQLNALDRLSGAGMQAAQIPQQAIQDYLAYIGAGNQAGGVANQTAQLGLNQANLGFNQGQTLGSNLGSSLSGLQKAFTGWGQGGNILPTGWGSTGAQPGTYGAAQQAGYYGEGPFA